MAAKESVPCTKIYDNSCSADKNDFENLRKLIDWEYRAQMYFTFYCCCVSPNHLFLRTLDKLPAAEVKQFKTIGKDTVRYEIGFPIGYKQV